jgi:hypothetical protein
MQPLKRSLSTCTQSRSLLVTSKRVPWGAVPRILPVADGADLMFTPGRCRKRISRFWGSLAGEAPRYYWLVRPWRSAFPAAPEEWKPADLAKQMWVAPKARLVEG